MHPLIRSVVVAMALLVFTSLAFGTTMIVSCTTLNDFTELNGNLSCPQFTGVNLQSISISLTGSINGTITLTNNGAKKQTGSAQTLSEFSIGPLLGFSILDPLFSASFNTGSATIGPHLSQIFAGLFGSGSATILDTTNFTGYTGAGDFLIPVLTATNLTVFGGGGNFASSQSTSGTASAEVTYTFNDSNVPEGSTSELMAGGLVMMGFGLFRRRLRRDRR